MNYGRIVIRYLKLDETHLYDMNMRSNYTIKTPFLYTKEKTNNIIKADLYDTIKSDNGLKIGGETITSLTIYMQRTLQATLGNSYDQHLSSIIEGLRYLYWRKSTHINWRNKTKSLQGWIGKVEEVWIIFVHFMIYVDYIKSYRSWWWSFER